MLRGMQGHLELSADHLGSWVRESDSPCSHILYAEQWRSEEAIFHHIRSSLYRRVLGAMEFSTRAPEVSFYFVSHTRGMELIHDLRGAALPKGNES